MGQWVGLGTRRKGKDCSYTAPHCRYVFAIFLVKDSMILASPHSLCYMGLGRGALPVSRLHQPRVMQLLAASREVMQPRWGIWCSPGAGVFYLGQEDGTFLG